MSDYLVMVTVYEDGKALPPLRMALESIGHIPAMIQAQIVTVQGLREEDRGKGTAESAEGAKGEEDGGKTHE